MEANRTYGVFTDILLAGQRAHRLKTDQGQTRGETDTATSARVCWAGSYFGFRYRTVNWILLPRRRRGTLEEIMQLNVGTRPVTKKQA